MKWCGFKRPNPVRKKPISLFTAHSAQPAQMTRSSAAWRRTAKEKRKPAFGIVLPDWAGFPRKSGPIWQHWFGTHSPATALSQSAARFFRGEGRCLVHFRRVVVLMKPPRGPRRLMLWMPHLQSVFVVHIAILPIVFALSEIKSIFEHISYCDRFDWPYSLWSIWSGSSLYGICGTNSTYCFRCLPLN